MVHSRVPSLTLSLLAQLPPERPPSASRNSSTARAPARAANPKTTGLSPEAPLHEAAVLRLVDVAADERLAVGRARDAGQVAIEHHLGHAGGDLDLGFQDVRLRREEQSLLQYPGR